MYSHNQKEKKWNNGLLSIVVPVYNGERYIEKCIRSILTQTYKDIEIIIVNDGSNDNTLAVCNKLISENHRIILLNQSNKGVVEARRMGIRAATGDYITFVDADDWIEANMYETLLRKIGNTSLVTSGYYKEYDNGKYVLYKDMLGSGIYSGEKMLYLRNNLICNQDNGHEPFSTNLWSKIFITKKCKEIAEYDYGEVYYGEDALFLYNYVLNVDSITVTDDVFYHYCVRKDNTTNSVNDYYLSNVSNFYLTATRIIENEPEYDVLKKQLEKQIVRMLFSGINTRMGFSEENRLSLYYFRNLTKLHGKRVVLYGAGAVGIDYYCQFEKYGIDVVAWIDSGKEDDDNKPEIVTRFVANDIDFDIVIIALKSEETAKEIEAELIETYNISAGKIVWEAPREVI